VTDDEIRAELQALLSHVGSGESEWADGTPEGVDLWRASHPEIIRVESTYWGYRATATVVGRSESRLQRTPLAVATL
jgi:hypothetical protein